MRHTKMSMWLLVVVILIVGLAITGCAPAEAPVEEEVDEEVFVDEKVYQLKMSHHSPEGSPVHRYAHAVWAEEVAEATDGRVKIDIYAGSTLGSPFDMYELLKAGTVDIAWGFIGFFPEQFPLSEVMALPFLGFESALHSSLVFWDLYENYPFLKNEYEEIKVLFVQGDSAAPVSTKGVAVRQIDDLRGLTIRTPAGPALETIVQLGGATETFPTSEIYRSMETGVIDGFTLSYEGITGFGLYEVAEYYAHLNVYPAVFWIAMNKQVWNDLPIDLQEAILGVSGLHAAELYGNAFDRATQEAFDVIAEHDGEIIEFSDEELDIWREAVKPVWDNWVKKREEQGLPAQDVLDTVLELVEKHRN